MTDLTPAQARQQNNRSTDGRYTEGVKTDQGAEALQDEGSPEFSAARAVAKHFTYARREDGHFGGWVRNGDRSVRFGPGPDGRVTMSMYQDFTPLVQGLVVTGRQARANGVDWLSEGQKDCGPDYEPGRSTGLASAAVGRLERKDGWTSVVRRRDGLVLGQPNVDEYGEPIPHAEIHAGDKVAVFDEVRREGRTVLRVTMCEGMWSRGARRTVVGDEAEEAARKFLRLRGQR